MNDQLNQFLGFLDCHKLRQVNFLILLLILLLMPVSNYYTSLDISAQRPVIRPLEINLSQPAEYPVNVTGRPAPALSAYSVLAVDVPSRAVIYSKNPDQPLFPASTTKIMTALVSLEAYQLDRVLTVGRLESVGQTMGLEEGEKITVENLLYGLLVQSANDSADVLAANYPGGTEAFVDRMNEKAEQLHLEATQFANPSGIDAYQHRTTAHDLAVLAAEALNQPIIAEMVAVEEIEVSDVTGEIDHQLENINELLGKVAGLKGVKTGWTVNAGECLVAYTTRNGRQVITVVLASRDRFGETQKLIDWLFANFDWEQPYSPSHSSVTAGT